jgi:preprotein translocase subunit Sec61beta
MFFFLWKMVSNVANFQTPVPRAGQTNLKKNTYRDGGRSHNSMGSSCSSRSCSVRAEALRYSNAFDRISLSPPVAVAAAVAVSAAVEEVVILLGSRRIRRIHHSSQLRLSSFQDRFLEFLQLFL